MKSQKNDVAAGQEVNLAYYQIVSVFKEKVKDQFIGSFFMESNSFLKSYSAYLIILEA